jgi:FKBP-type peptidyl-prolyl cis-trans isomerase FkpA
MPLSRPLLVLFGLLLLSLAGCDSVEDPPLIEETTFAPELEVDLAAMTRTDSGLYYRDVEVGTGPAIQSGYHVYVYYTGWLPSGTRFDGRSQTQGEEPLDFPLGRGVVIRGWDEGLVGMRVGGTRQLVIPPHLGYGSTPRPTIPANSILVFHVTVVGFR